MRKDPGFHLLRCISEHRKYTLIWENVHQMCILGALLCINESGKAQIFLRRIQWIRPKYGENYV